MARTRRVRLVAVVGYAVTALAILAASLLAIDPGSRSAYFWHRVLWTEFLALLPWAFVGGFFSATLRDYRASRSPVGVFPAVGVLLSTYSLFSFALMLGSAFAPGGAFERLHLVLQVVLAAVVGVVFVLLYLPLVGARAGTEAIPGDLSSPVELAAKLKVEEQRWAEAGGMCRELAQALKRLREKAQYSLHHVGAVGVSSAYRDLVDDVEELCRWISSVDPKSDEAAPTSKMATEQAERLVRQVDIVAASVVRR